MKLKKKDIEYFEDIDEVVATSSSNEEESEASSTGTGDEASSDSGSVSGSSSSGSTQGEKKKKRRKKKGSKYFKLRNVSDSEDADSGDEKERSINAFESFSESDSEGDEKAKKEIEKVQKKKLEERKRRQKRDAILESDEDSGDDKRIVVSHRQKRIIQLRDYSESIPKNIKSGDWISVAEDFKQVVKTVETMFKSDDVRFAPYEFLKLIVETQKTVFDLNKDKKYKKSLAPTQAKELGSLRNKTNNVLKTYVDEVEEYEKDPEQYEDDHKLVDDFQPIRKIRDDDASSSSSSSSSSVDESNLTIEELRAKRRKKWLLPDASSSSDSSDEDESGEESPSKVKTKPEKQKKLTDKQQRRLDRQRTAETTQQEKQTPAQAQGSEKKWTDSMIKERLYELRAERRRRVNIEEVKQDLIKLTKHAKTAEVKLQVKMEWVATALEGFNSNYDTNMKVHTFMQCYRVLSDCLNMVSKFSKNIKLLQVPPTAVPGEEKRGVLYLSYTFVTAFEFLDDAFWRNLQTANDNSLEYIEHLKVEWSIINMAERIYRFYNEPERFSSISSHRHAVLAIRILKHVYYRTNEDHKVILHAHRQQAKSNNIVFSNYVITEDLSGLMEELVQDIYKNSPDLELHYEALLMHIFSLAKNGNFHRARQMTLKGGFQKDGFLARLSVPVQTLYNRAIAQLGICAFSKGLYSDVTSLLAPLEMHNAHELLGQKVTHTSDMVNIDVEKSRLFPGHLHIHVDLLESIYLMSALIAELPKIYSCSFEVRTRPYSAKQFHHAISNIKNRDFIAPPDSTRDYIYHAYVCLHDCNWQKAYDILLQLSCWKRLDQTEDLQKELLSALKLAALQLHLFRFSKYFTTLSLTQLEEMFALDREVVHSQISKLIVQELLFVNIDQPSNTINCDTRTEPTSLHRHGNFLADSIMKMSRMNDNIYNLKTNQFFGSHHHRDYHHSRKSDNRGKSASSSSDHVDYYAREATITHLANLEFKNIGSSTDSGVLASSNVPLHINTDNGNSVQLVSKESGPASSSNLITVVQLEKNHSLGSNKFHTCTYWVKSSENAQQSIDQFNLKLRDIIPKLVKSLSDEANSHHHFLHELVSQFVKNHKFHPFKLLIQFDNAPGVTFELNRSRDKFISRSPTAGTPDDERSKPRHNRRHHHHHHSHSHHHSHRRHHSHRQGGRRYANYSRQGGSSNSNSNKNRR